MGIFSFIKEAGEKLFGKAHAAEPEQLGETAVPAIKNYIADQGLQVEQLDVQYDVASQTVTVKGEVPSQEVREKIILCCGNVEGVANVTDELSVAATDEQESEFYTVVKGDTLSAIAKKFYGNANGYMVIFEANKPMLTHPDKIYPGQNLRIPAKK